jgi:citrate lyase subunit beta/citryl-CoA lyase
VAGVILPRAGTAETVGAVANALGLPVIALIESARGLAQARASKNMAGVAWLAFGSVDLCADLASVHVREVKRKDRRA